MNAVYRATIFTVCLALMACGNKGDLFLNKVELSAEEKAILEGTDLEDIEDVERSEDPEDVEELEDSEDLKKSKKKSSSTTQSDQ